MNVGKVLLGAGVAVGMLSSTVAMAAETNAANSAPALQNSATAPVSGVRATKALSKKSSQSDNSTGTYVVAGLAALAVAGGIVAVATDNNSNPSSGG